jgi:hypothetical protein
VWLAGSERSDAVNVLLSQRSALCHGAGIAQVLAVSKDDASPGELLLAALQALIHATPKALNHQSPRGKHPATPIPVRLWLSGHAARPFMLPPASGIQRWAEWQTLAQATASQATGLSGPCQLWFSQRPGGQPVLAVATPASLVADCQSAAQQARCKLVQVRPWWSAALNHALHAPNKLLEGLPANSPCTVAALDPDALTVLSGPVSAASTAATEPAFALAHSAMPAPSAQQTPNALARLAFHRGVSLGTVVLVRSAVLGTESLVRCDLPFLHEAQRMESIAA